MAQNLVGAGFSVHEVNAFVDAPDLQSRVSSGIGVALLGLGTAHQFQQQQKKGGEIQNGQRQGNQGLQDIQDNGIGRGETGPEGSARAYPGEGQSSVLGQPEPGRATGGGGQAQRGDRSPARAGGLRSGNNAGAEPATGLPSSGSNAAPTGQLPAGSTALTPQGPLQFKPFAEALVKPEQALKIKKLRTQDKLFDMLKDCLGLIAAAGVTVGAGVVAERALRK